MNMIICFLYQAPTIENLVFLSDCSFDVESLVKMENTVLKMLDFNISVFTSYHFASRIALAAKMTEKEQTFMFYLLGNDNVPHISYLHTYLSSYLFIYPSTFIHECSSINLSICLLIFQLIQSFTLENSHQAFRSFCYISSTGI